eukprot:Clim_evm4s8 gene=Clim_evmTU4s8
MKLNWRNVKKVWNGEIPTNVPLDVPNLISFKDETYYKYYGITLIPFMWVFSFGPRFFGRLTKTVHGPGLLNWDHLILVRYPHHWYMLFMIFNPIYMFISDWFRTRGTKWISIQWTTPIVDRQDRLKQADGLIGVHMRPNASGNSIRQLESVCLKRNLEVVYLSKPYAPGSLPIIEKPGRHGPHAPTHKILACLRPLSPSISASGLSSVAEDALKDLLTCVDNPNDMIVNIYETRNPTTLGKATIPAKTKAA